MSYRDDVNALYVRAEALERDLERARAELAELRGEARATTVANWPPYSPAPAPQSPLIVAADHPRDEHAHAPSDGVLAVLESLHSRPAPPALASDYEFEEAIGRAVELLVPELIARHRGVSGDGSHAQLLGLLDLLVALWHEHSSGGPRAGVRSFGAVEQLVHDWPPHNELARVFRQLGDYYCKPR